MEIMNITPLSSTASRPKPFPTVKEAKVDEEGRAPTAPKSVALAQELSLQQQAQPVTTVQQGVVDQSLTEKNVQQGIAEINIALEQMGHREIKLSVDDKTGDVIVQVIDSDSEEILRQIPSKEVIRLREHLAEMKGILINEER